MCVYACAQRNRCALFVFVPGTKVEFQKSQCLLLCLSQIIQYRKLFTVTVLFLLILLFYIRDSFTCMYICAQVYLIPGDVTCQIPWKRSGKRYESSCWRWKLTPATQ